VYVLYQYYFIHHTFCETTKLDYSTVTTHSHMSTAEVSFLDLCDD